MPRFLGNRRLRTPFVCRACNGGLGGTLDLALKSAPGVAAACFNRMAGRSRGERGAGQAVRLDSLFGEYCGGRERGIDNHCIDSHGNDNHGINNYGINNHGIDSRCADNHGINKNHCGDLLKNHAVRGAVLKIAYESAHLRLGDAYLADPAAAAVRETLFAFVNREKGRAYELLGAAKVYAIDINAFHAAVRAPRCEFVKRAIAGKSCLNSIWLVPLKSTGEAGQALAAVIDIEGLPPGYAVVGGSAHGIEAPELIFPRG